MTAARSAEERGAVQRDRPLFIGGERALGTRCHANDTKDSTVWREYRDRDASGKASCASAWTNIA